MQSMAILRVSRVSMMMIVIATSLYNHHYPHLLTALLSSKDGPELLTGTILTMIDKNRDTISFYGGNVSDIKLNHWEYHDFIDQLLDDRLTAEGLMKFKRLHSHMSMNTIVIPVLSFFPAYLCNRWLAGFVDRGLASSRYNFIGMTIFYPVFLWWGFTRPIPRKLYTDLIADNGADGSYIREVLRTRKPGLWQQVSKQLFDNKFMFSEMNEYTGTEFGGGFVNHRVY